MIVTMVLLISLDGKYNLLQVVKCDFDPHKYNLAYQH